MGTYDVRLITATYRRDPEEGPEAEQRPVIQLFGRTREGKSIAIECKGFKPYFFATNPSRPLRAMVAKDPGVDHVEDRTLEVGGRATLCLTIVFHNPLRTPE